MALLRRDLLCFSCCLAFSVAVLAYLAYDYLTTSTTAATPPAPASYFVPTDQSSTLIQRYQKRFPSAIIIGSKKGGTSALRNILRYHPKIRIADNEVVYFSHQGHYSKGMEWYLQQMPLSTSDQVTMEKSPQYFTSTLAPRRLHEVSTDIKLLLVVRNPLMRAVSDYYFEQRRGNHRSFTQKVMVNSGKINTGVSEIKVSMYDVHYKQWLKWFPKKQILIVDGDNLKVNPKQELGYIEKFLNIPHFFGDEMFHYSNVSHHYYLKTGDSSKNHSVGKQNNHDFTKLSRRTLKKVAVFLQPHARKFCQATKVKFHWCKDMYSDVINNNAVL